MSGVSEKVPPGARCTTNGCNRKAVNPDHPAGLCPQHHPKRGDDNRHVGNTPRTEVVEGEVNKQNVGDTADVLINDARSKIYPTKDDSLSLNPNSDCELPGSAATDDDHRYPPTLVERDYWVAWIVDSDERKRPVAPWQTGHAYPVEWRADLDDNDRPEVGFATAKRWTEFPPSDLGLSLPDDARSDTLRFGVILPADRPPHDSRVVLIDWDDVRDPETGEIHPVAREYIDEYGGYVGVSRSGEGLHQYVLGGSASGENSLPTLTASRLFLAAMTVHK